MISLRFGYRLAAITALAFVLRVIIAYNGGIWADEGSFLNAVAAPSWSSMIEFLRLHESHPPLFYLITRAWGAVTGGGDRAMMMLPVLLGTSIVPAMYLIATKLFSERVAMYAALLAAISAPLAEHASQLRPYGLLGLLALLSSGALSLALTRGQRSQWMGYAIATSLLLYTHNWGWVILCGQCAATLVVVARMERPARWRTMRAWILSLAVVFVLFAPWFPALVYQSRHAGHGSLDIEGGKEAFAYVLFSLYRILESLVVGHLSSRTLVAIAGMVAAVLSFGFVTTTYKSRVDKDDDEVLKESSTGAASMSLMLLIAGFALLAAVIVSPANNLLLPRGIATVAPMLLLAAAWWIDRALSAKGNRSHAQLASVIIGFGVVASTIELVAVAQTTRSNVREIAHIIQAHVDKSDLLVIAPEWFAASFDHYFPPVIEQIDFPFDGRSSLIDFSDVWESRQNTAAVTRLTERLSNARSSNRRVWYVLERRYLKKFRPEQLERAYRNRQPGAITVQTVQGIRTTLTGLYGPPQKVYETGYPKPIHDELIAFLFVPNGDSLRKQ